MEAIMMEAIVKDCMKKTADAQKGFMIEKIKVGLLEKKIKGDDMFDKQGNLCCSIETLIDFIKEKIND